MSTHKRFELLAQWIQDDSAKSLALVNDLTDLVDRMESGALRFTIPDLLQALKKSEKEKSDDHDSEMLSRIMGE